MDINEPDIPPHQVNELVNNTLHKGNSTLPVSIPADIINKSTFKNKVHTIPVLQVLNRKVINQLPTVSKKSTKWDNLPKWKHSGREHKPVKKYRYLSINDAVTINKSINLVFIAMANELHTYYEAF